MAYLEKKFIQRNYVVYITFFCHYACFFPINSFWNQRNSSSICSCRKVIGDHEWNIWSDSGTKCLWLMLSKQTQGTWALNSEPLHFHESFRLNQPVLSMYIHKKWIWRKFILGSIQKLILETLYFWPTTKKALANISFLFSNNKWQPQAAMSSLSLGKREEKLDITIYQGHCRWDFYPG